MNQEVNDGLLLTINISVYILIFTAIFVNYGLHKSADKPFAFVVEVCIRGESARPAAGWPALIGILLNLSFQVVKCSFFVSQQSS